jgi:hypothetical protein
MKTWRSLENVPQDGTEVLFWVPENDAHPFDEGRVVAGRYDHPLDDYFDKSGDLIAPICWTPLPRGPRNFTEIFFYLRGE